MQPGDVYRQAFVTHNECGRLAAAATDGSEIGCEVTVFRSNAAGFGAIPPESLGLYQLQPAVNAPPGHWVFVWPMPATFAAGDTIHPIVRYSLPGGWIGVPLRPEVLT